MQSTSQFPYLEWSLVYSTPSSIAWVSKLSIKSAISAKRRGLASALEAPWEFRVILTNQICHNVNEILMRIKRNGNTINPLDSQKKQGLC